MEEAQCGPRKQKGTHDLIFVMRRLEKNHHICYIGTENAFNKVNGEGIWNSLNKREILQNIVSAVKRLYANNCLVMAGTKL